MGSDTLLGFALSTPSSLRIVVHYDRKDARITSSKVGNKVSLSNLIKNKTYDKPTRRMFKKRYGQRV